MGAGKTCDCYQALPPDITQHKRVEILRQKEYFSYVYSGVEATDYTDIIIHEYLLADNKQLAELCEQIYDCVPHAYDFPKSATKRAE